MKKYIKPISECFDSEMTLPIMMSLHDEVGDGQLANSFEFEEDDDEADFKTLNDNLQIGF